MNRRRLLQLGLAAGTVFGVAGLSVAWLPSPYREGRLSASSRAIFAAVARPLLEGSLAGDAAAQQLVGRVEGTIAGLPAHVRDELGTLLRLLATAPGRLLLAGEAADWTDMPPPALAAVLQSMRRSSLELRQQAYHALREITVGAYFADPSTWGALGYPGPLKI